MNENNRDDGSLRLDEVFSQRSQTGARPFIDSIPRNGGRNLFARNGFDLWLILEREKVARQSTCFRRLFGVQAELITIQTFAFWPV
jgi:hypothetical protein